MSSKTGFVPIINLFRYTMSVMIYRYLFYPIGALWLFSSSNVFAQSTKLANATNKESLKNYPNMQFIRGGEYQVPFSEPASKIITIKSFYLDTYPVSNQNFKKFLAEKPAWQPSKVIGEKADQGYLRLWRTKEGNYRMPKSKADYPVTNVSWYAATAYCQAQGKRLPTNNEWDYAALASKSLANGSFGLGYREKILIWYKNASEAPTRDIDRHSADYWGLHDMNGFIWQWTADYGDLPITDGSQTRSMASQQLCGVGSTIPINTVAYIQYVRYAFRLNLMPITTMDSLGFRCAI